MCALYFSTARCGLGGACIILVHAVDPLSIGKVQSKFVGVECVHVEYSHCVKA
jgi:hypothetical protein